jgi:hypothetical protein
MNISTALLQLRQFNKDSYINKIHNANAIITVNEHVGGQVTFTFLPNLHEIVSASWVYKEQAYLSKEQLKLISRYMLQADLGLVDQDLIQLDTYFGSLRNE